jgi:hypothetical protein
MQALCCYTLVQQQQQDYTSSAAVRHIPRMMQQQQGFCCCYGALPLWQKAGGCRCILAHLAAAAATPAHM